VRVPAMPSWMVVVYYTILILILGEGSGDGVSVALRWLRGRQLRRLAAALLAVVCLAWYLSPPAAAGRLAICFLDVGQGDAALVRTPSGLTMVVDTGLYDVDSGYDNGRSVLLPALYRLGWLPVDWLVISHLHDDHTGGALSLLKSGLVHRLVLPVASTTVETEAHVLTELVEVAQDRGAEVSVWQCGVRVKMGSEASVNVLYPPMDFVSQGGANHHSMVLRLEYRRFSVLFTGDIEEPGERKLVEWARQAPVTDGNGLEVTTWGEVLEANRRQLRPERSVDLR